MPEIRDKANLLFKPGDMVFIDHKMAYICRGIHKKTEKHLRTTCMIIKIIEKEDFDSWLKPYTYYVYLVLVGNEKLEFGQDVLSAQPLDRDRLFR